MGWFQAQSTTYLNRLKFKGLLKLATDRLTPNENERITRCIMRNNKYLSKFKGRITDNMTIFLKNPGKEYGDAICMACKGKKEKGCESI